MSSKEKKYRRVMIITIVISIISILGTLSYAFYQTTINGNINGPMAKWSFTANNQTDSFSLDLGELYPGKTGTYNVTLSAEASTLDVYYELIFTGSDTNYFMTWDSAGENHLSDYVGRYGIITKGSSVTIPVYFNWQYNSPYSINGVVGEELYEELSVPKIKIIARQYTGYSGSIPMNLLGFTNLISYNDLNKTNTIKISYNPYDSYGYLLTNQYKFETVTSTSGYILNGNF